MTCRGFTLTEMLVVVAIVAMIAAVLLPTVENAGERARRTVCAANQRQILLAAIAFSTDTPAKIYIPTRSGSEDSIGYLYPRYVSDPNVGACPSTENRIRADVMYATSMTVFGRQVPHDLCVAASDALDENGLSFEIFTWNDGPAIFPDGQEWNGNLLGTINDQRRVVPGDLTYVEGAGKTGDTLKNRRNVKSPSTDLILLDSDQGGAVGTMNVNNWPDPVNNHREHGLNIGFCDGHVSWIPAEPVLIETYMNAHMVAASNWNLMHPKIRVSSVSQNGYTYKKYYYAP